MYAIKPLPGPWGEYSEMLIHGMASLFQRGMGGELLLERMGPHIPPMTFPSGQGPVVTDELKQRIEAEGLTGAEFRPVIKKHISLSRWHEWDITAPRPKRYPRYRKAENYVLFRPHSPEAAAEMGELWELRASDGAALDFRKPEDGPGLVVSGRAKEVVVEHGGEWVAFERIVNG